ncbi:hypothetical protein E2P81_ATG12003 [Venturia nashicola]|nr:hypothetical protein E2P81_ATG12003 [Venturia nashicola]
MALNEGLEQELKHRPPNLCQNAVRRPGAGIEARPVPVVLDDKVEQNTPMLHRIDNLSPVSPLHQLSPPLLTLLFLHLARIGTLLELQERLKSQQLRQQPAHQA